MEPVEFGRYRLIRRIAAGGMAQIYLAVQRGAAGFEKVAVLKVILPEHSANDDFVQMFLDEARLAANLDHNNVVRVYDFGEHEGQYYLAMEYLPGEDLASILQAARKQKKLIPIEVAVDLAICAAHGLHSAHELKGPNGKLLNVVHRDVSPSNVILTYNGTVKLVDFGIARAESNITKTAAGTLKGKVAYCSPEQALGEPVDRRSDIFALGLVLHELLTNVRVFKRDSDLATMKAVLEDPVPPPSARRAEVPPELDAIVMQSIERAADKRHQTAADFADALAEWLVKRGYVRSDKKLADFIAGLFDAERKQAKLVIHEAVTPGEPVSGVRLKTPSALQHLPAHLSPIRSKSEMKPIPDFEPEPPPPAKSPLPWIVGGVVALALVAIGGAIVLKQTATPVVVLELPDDPPRKPTPVAPRPAVQPEPQPEPPPEPVVKKDPEPAPAPAAEVKKTVKAQPKGKLTLDTQPYTEVFLNNKRLGDTPIVELPLPAGFHTLKLVNESKKISHRIEVEITAGKTTVKKLKL